MTIYSYGYWSGEWGNWVSLFPSRICLLNLAQNAIEACQSGDRVEIAAEGGAPGKGASITVRDSGPGLAPDVLSRLFSLGFGCRWARCSTPRRQLHNQDLRI